jgi:hypothetical protein
MTETSDDSGIYEYSVTFEWGRGEHTIICKEETEGTLDGINIEVISTDLEDLADTASSSLARIMTLDTSQLSLLTPAITEINNVVSGILDNIDELSELSKKVSDLADKTSVVIYKQLEAAMHKLREINEGQGLKLEAMYELSEEQATDVDYIKNKTLEIKALVELSKELIAAESEEPIVKTWMELELPEGGVISDTEVEYEYDAEDIEESLEGLREILPELEGLEIEPQREEAIEAEEEQVPETQETPQAGIEETQEEVEPLTEEAQEAE